MKSDRLYFNYNSPGVGRTPVEREVRIDTATAGFRLTQRQGGTPMVEVDGNKDDVLASIDALVDQLQTIRARL